MTRLPFLCVMLMFASVRLTAQDSESQSGNFSLGVRGVLSTFNHGKWNENGIGAGGHFRIQMIDRINTEWYADVISNSGNRHYQRMDYHIGWSVMVYWLNNKEFKRLVTPFAEAGHCFDWSHIRLHLAARESKTRFSSAVQAGIGTHFNITPRFDITVKSQYMFHLGPDIHVHLDERREPYIDRHRHAAWEGHLLFTVSSNYKIGKLWNRRK